VSPFSSANPSIFCIVDVLRFGRATLATAFASYKCMILWGQVTLWLALVKNYYFISMQGVNWLFVDFVVCLGITSTLTLAEPKPKLSSRRPTASLLGPSTMGSVLGHVVINFVCMCVAYVTLSAMPWYTRFDPSQMNPQDWQLLGDNYEAALLFVLSITQVTNSGVVMNFGGQFRRSFFRNWQMMTVWFSLTGFVFYMVLVSSPTSCYFRVNCDGQECSRNGWTSCGSSDTLWPVDYRFGLATLLAINIASLFLWERLVIQGPVANSSRAKYHIDKLPVII